MFRNKKCKTKKEKKRNKAIPVLILYINNIGPTSPLPHSKKKKYIRTPQNKSSVKREKNPHIKNVKMKKIRCHR